MKKIILVAMVMLMVISGATKVVAELTQDALRSIEEAGEREMEKRKRAVLGETIRELLMVEYTKEELQAGIGSPRSKKIKVIMVMGDRTLGEMMESPAFSNMVYGLIGGN